MLPSTAKCVTVCLLVICSSPCVLSLSANREWLSGVEHTGKPRAATGKQIPVLCDSWKGTSSPCGPRGTAVVARTEGDQLHVQVANPGSADVVVGESHPSTDADAAQVPHTKSQKHEPAQSQLLHSRRTVPGLSHRQLAGHSRLSHVPLFLARRRQNASNQRPPSPPPLRSVQAFPARPVQTPLLSRPLVSPTRRLPPQTATFSPRLRSPLAATDSDARGPNTRDASGQGSDARRVSSPSVALGLGVGSTAQQRRRSEGDSGFLQAALRLAVRAERASQGIWDPWWTPRGREGPRVPVRARQSLGSWLSSRQMEEEIRQGVEDLHRAVLEVRLAEHRGPANPRRTRPGQH